VLGLQPHNPRGFRSPRTGLGICCRRRVGPGNFTPSPSQNRTGRSHVIRLVPPVEGYRLPLRTWGSSCCQLTRSQLGDRLPSLHGHYPASSLLRSRPPLSGASVLSASRDCRLCLFPWHRRPGSHVPYESPHESHASCTPDITWPVRRLPPCCSRSTGGTPVLMSSNGCFDASSEVRLRSSLSSIHDVITATPFNQNVHHHGFCPQQLLVV